MVISSRQSSCEVHRGRSGAGDGIRTRDILLGKQTLCQLSYSRTVLAQRQRLLERERHSIATNPTLQCSPEPGECMGGASRNLGSRRGTGRPDSVMRHRSRTFRCHESTDSIDVLERAHSDRLKRARPRPVQHRLVDHLGSTVNPRRGSLSWDAA